MKRRAGYAFAKAATDFSVKGLFEAVTAFDTNQLIELTRLEVICIKAPGGEQIVVSTFADQLRRW